MASKDPKVVEKDSPGVADQASSSQKDPVLLPAVIVSGIPEIDGGITSKAGAVATAKAVKVHFFKKKNGRAKVEDVKLISAGVARVAFTTEDDAKRVLKLPHVFRTGEKLCLMPEIISSAMVMLSPLVQKWFPMQDLDSACTRFGVKFCPDEEVCGSWSDINRLNDYLMRCIVTETSAGAMEPVAEVLPSVEPMAEEPMAEEPMAEVPPVAEPMVVEPEPEDKPVSFVSKESPTGSSSTEYNSGTTTEASSGTSSGKLKHRTTLTVLAPAYLVVKYHFKDEMNKLFAAHSCNVRGSPDGNEINFAAADEESLKACVDNFSDVYQDNLQEFKYQTVPLAGSVSKADLKHFREQHPFVAVTNPSDRKAMVYGYEKDVIEVSKLLEELGQQPVDLATLARISGPSSCGVSGSQVSVETAQSHSVGGSRSAEASRGVQNFSPALVIDQCVLPNGVTLALLEGDITRQRVDAIVNAANDRLKHIGGVAYAIARAGGYDVEHESNSLMQKRGHRPLRVSEAVHTRAGRLPCQHIIHTVGPVWSSYSADQCERQLADACQHSLELAARLNCQSIALPAISSGVYGMPVAVCARVMLRAIQQFGSMSTARASTLQDIRLVLFQANVVQAFRSEFLRGRLPTSTGSGSFYEQPPVGRPATGKTPTTPVSYYEKPPVSSPTSAEPTPRNNAGHNSSSTDGWPTPGDSLQRHPKTSSSAISDSHSHSGTSNAGSASTRESSHGAPHKEAAVAGKSGTGSGPATVTTNGSRGATALGTAVHSTPASAKTTETSSSTSADPEREISQHPKSTGATYTNHTTLNCTQSLSGKPGNHTHVLPTKPCGQASAKSKVNGGGPTQHSSAKPASSGRQLAFVGNRTPAKGELCSSDGCHLTAARRRNCGHSFCEDCYLDQPTSSIENKCFMCLQQEASGDSESETGESSSGLQAGDNGRLVTLEGGRGVTVTVPGTLQDHSAAAHSVTQHADSTNSLQGSDKRQGERAHLGPANTGETSPAATSAESTDKKAAGCDNCHGIASERHGVKCGHQLCAECWKGARADKDLCPVEMCRKSLPQAAASPEDLDCDICLEHMKQPRKLHCGHQFCVECVHKAEAAGHYLCPACRVPFKPAQGTQPHDGQMSTSNSRTPLDGYGSVGSITIQYRIPSGTQTRGHPNPGRSYSGTSRTAYLPDNKEGRNVLGLLRKAFKARLIFTVGESRTSGATDTVTWNDIHHKTARSGGTSNFGYPDPTYLTRVREELAAKGIV